MAQLNLCQACNLLLHAQSERYVHPSTAQPYYSRWYTEKYYTHHPDAESFHKALQLPCAICTRLWIAFTRPAAEGVDLASTQYYVKIVGPLHNRQTFNFECGNLSTDLLFDLCSADLPATSHSSQVDSTGSESALEYLLSQYHRCQTQHVACQAGQSQSGFFPTRLLDVGTAGHGLIHLRGHGELMRDAPYFTLSHCWGGSQPFRLISDTASQLKRGIDAKLLPKTFQDAIRVARKFQIRYIWIDSL